MRYMILFRKSKMNHSQLKGRPGYSLPWDTLRHQMTPEQMDALGCPDELLPDYFFPYRTLTDMQIWNSVRDWIPSDLLPAASDIIRNLRDPVNLCDIRVEWHKRPDEPNNYCRYIGAFGKRYCFLAWPGRLVTAHSGRGHSSPRPTGHITKRKRRRRT
jgi:hypothetical protein